MRMRLIFSLAHAFNIFLNDVLVACFLVSLCIPVPLYRSPEVL